MKKLFLLFPLIAFLLYFTLSSSRNGAATSSSAGDRTGARGSSSGCSGCHGGSATSGIAVSVTLDSAGTTVTRYVAGGTYNVVITATNGSGSTLPRYGFQVAAVKSSGAGSSSAEDAGTLSATSGSTLRYTVSSTFHLIEHSTRLSPSSGSGTSGSTTYSFSIPWTAPSAGTGSVILYGVLNAVNNDGSSSSADKWNIASPTTITELTTAATIGAITGPSDVCVGNTITLSDTSAGGTWSSSDTTVARIGASTGVVTGVSIGIAYITYTTSAGSAYDTITVNPAATAGVISGPRPRRVCVGSSITLTNSVGGGSWITGSPSIASINPSSGAVTGISAGTAFISYMVVSASCGPAYALDTVRVISTPVVGAISGAVTLCTGDTTRMTDTTLGGTWSVSTTGRITINSSGLVTGISAGADTVYYTVTNVCGATRVSHIINVFTTPDPGTISGASPVCVSTPITFTTSGATGGTWSSGSTSIASVSSGGVVYGIATGSTVISYTVSAGTCGPRSATYPITVLISVSAGAITGVDSVCEGSTTSLSSTTSGGVWSASPTSVGTINAASGLFRGIAAGTSTVSYIVTSSCGTDTSFYTVTVNTNPVPGTITGASSICIGDSTILANATASPSGIWSSGSVGIASINASTGKVFGITSGTVTISYTVNTPACGTAYALRTFSVNGTPSVPAFTGPSAICVGSTATYTDSITGGRWSSSPSAVATIDSISGTLTGLSAGSVTVVYRVTTACGSATALPRAIAVNNPATPGSISGPSVTCVGDLDTFSVTGGLAGGTWSSSSVTVATVTNTATGIVYGANIGLATISYSVATAGCAPSVATFPISVSTTPSAGSIFGASTVCTGGSTSLSATVPGGTWSTSSSAVASVNSATGDVFGVSGGGATITYTVVNSCGSAFTTFPITVTTPPVVSPISGLDSVCEGGATVTFSSTTTGGTWASSVSSLATVSATGIVTGLFAGTSTISYTVTNSCGATTVTKNVLVKSLPSGGIISGPTVICTGTSASLTASITGGVWNSSATSVASINTAGAVNGIVAGTATISYAVTNYCGTAYATYPISVTATPTLGTISGSDTICNGSSALYTYSGTSGGSWFSSSPSVVTVGMSSGLGTAFSTGTATITYILTSSCRSDTVTKTIVAVASPLAGVISGVSGICVGATTLLTTTGTGGSWTSATTSVATVDAAGLVTGVGTGSAIISYTAATASCGTAVATYTVAVANAPSAGIVSGLSVVCEGSSISLTTTATGGSWSSNNTSVATVNAAGVVTGAGAGIAGISYIVTNACGTDSAGQNITVNPLPLAGGISGPSSVCPGASVTLVHTGSAGTWSSGTPSVATVDAAGVVTGISAGSSTISYAVTNSCGTAYATYVEIVNPLPSAGTVSGPSTLCTGTSATLSSTSGGGSWSSSDATVASINATTGSVFGVVSGSATISYIFTNVCGADTAYYPISVNTSASVGAISGPTAVCESSTITLTNPTSGGAWSSASPTVATVDASGVVTGLSGGTAVISYTSTTSCGTAIASYTITVNPLPVAGTITGIDSTCQGTTVTLSNATTGGTWTTSAASIASISVLGVVSGIATGTVTISYAVTNGCGTAYATRSFRVLPLPSAGTISGATAVCTGATIALTSTVTGGAWASSAAGIASVSASGIVSGISAGAAIITYTYTNSCGSATATHNVTVNTTPVLTAISGATSVCTGSTITLTNSTTGGTWTTSAPSVATIDATGVVTGLTSGSTVISYTVTNGCGSSTVTQTVNVNTTPSVAAITGALSVCPGATTALTSATTGGSWTTSASAIASVSATGVVSGIATGTAVISYQVTSACGTGFAIASVTVNALPFSGAISGRSVVCVGDTVVLSAAVAGGNWSSSASGIASVNTSGVVRALASGSANIIYSVTNVCGTASSAITLTVNPLAVAGIISGPYSVCRGGTITLTSSVSGGTWSSSSTALAVVSAAGIVTGVGYGLPVISYSVTNACGTSSANYVVSVDGIVADDNVSGPATVCVGDSVLYTASVPGGFWSGTTGNVYISSFGTLVGLTPGTDTIYYFLSNACGTSSARKVVTVLSAEDCSTGLNNGNGKVWSVIVHPNPSTGIFNIEVPSTNLPYEISVTDMAGRIINSFKALNGVNIIPVDLGNVAPGNYIVKISSGDKVVREKITIAK